MCFACFELRRFTNEHELLKCSMDIIAYLLANIFFIDKSVIQNVPELNSLANTKSTFLYDFK